MHFSRCQNSMVISIVLDCESVWTLTVDILNTVCNHDCFADCSLDSFVLENCIFGVLLKANNNITIPKLYSQFSTQCSNECQCVLSNFQWFLFCVMSVTVLYLGGGALFSGHCKLCKKFSVYSQLKRVSHKRTDGKTDKPWIFHFILYRLQ